jgi:hypothetical protein
MSVQEMARGSTSTWGASTGWTTSPTFTSQGSGNMSSRKDNSRGVTMNPNSSRFSWGGVISFVANLKLSNV